MNPQMSLRKRQARALVLFYGHIAGAMGEERYSFEKVIRAYSIVAADPDKVEELTLSLPRWSTTEFPEEVHEVLRKLPAKQELGGISIEDLLSSTL